MIKFDEASREDFRACTEEWYDPSRRRWASMMELSRARCLKMRHWILFAGATYPTITNATYYVPDFLKGHLTLDQRTRR